MPLASCRTTVEEKKFPGAAKVLKAKADKYLNQAWELHEHEDMELMKGFLQRKMDEEGCDALELAAAMLKMQVGDKQDEIAVDDFAIQRPGRFGDRGRERGGRGDRVRSFENRGRRDGSERRSAEGRRDGSERRSAESRRDGGERRSAESRRDGGERRSAEDRRGSSNHRNTENRDERRGTRRRERSDKYAEEK